MARGRGGGMIEGRIERKKEEIKVVEGRMDDQTERDRCEGGKDGEQLCK